MTAPGVTREQLIIWRERARLGELTNLDEARAAIAAIRHEYLSQPKGKADRVKAAPAKDQSAEF
jgi:hypothetical protein